MKVAQVRRMHAGLNPASWSDVQKYLSAKQPKIPDEHHPALPYVEMPSFMQELRSRHNIATPALEFCVLTATRTSETLKARWSEFDKELTTWTIPAARMGKTCKEHTVPISEQARRVLLRQRERGSEWVFPGYSISRPLADRSMRWLLSSMHPTATVHGMRSTFRDWGYDLTEFPRELIEQCLAHKPGAVEGAYRRSDALERRRVIMQAWANHCNLGGPYSVAMAM